GKAAEVVNIVGEQLARPHDSTRLHVKSEQRIAILSRWIGVVKNRADVQKALLCIYGRRGPQRGTRWAPDFRSSGGLADYLGRFRYRVRLPELLTVFRVDSNHAAAQSATFVARVTCGDFFLATRDRNIETPVHQLRCSGDHGQRMFVQVSLPDLFAGFGLEGVHV